MSEKPGTTVASFRLAISDLQDDEAVVFSYGDTYWEDDEEYLFEPEVHRTVNGYVEVQLRCPGLTDELKKLRDENEELTLMKERYATALRILERDAGISEQDLDVVENNVDPVAALVRMRAGARR